ncbi:bifunctional methionine sulfoxide reductase B/A protein [Ferrimonas lipolytica]|uniref:Peptide methionine sulfoxide reductase MsrA n=1 Tax=Ferrimonas lipolytica TaxID=2724191 RepID=A0A6H1UBL5_9GAMM|nr:bifunctional methionine sulfoxide reductase B/A protein [Ferrimonas lipolytica]QIZ76039.1 bifunctional methionine sulfoxide reductase B/A protein [Ferrimonas lipolytica]
MSKAPLTPQEHQVIEHKATEHPFSGRFLFLSNAGTFCCRRCDTALFKSESKFDAGCGWPSFDDEITGAVTRKMDADGRRTEILCSHCLGHLGHVFVGEKLTLKDTRHCVNAQALQFVPQQVAIEQQTAIFGGGCFWCLEALFQRVRGVVQVTSGYCGGHADTANYRAVCSGTSGHVEVIKIDFNPSEICFGQLLELFFDCHDPTSVDQQGADKGSQYRSAIFTMDDEQQQQAKQHMATMQQYSNAKLVTQIEPASVFYSAEEQHQNYFNDNAQQPYCAFNIAPKLAKLTEKYADRIKPQ